MAQGSLSACLIGITGGAQSREVPITRPPPTPQVKYKAARRLDPKQVDPTTNEPKKVFMNKDDGKFHGADFLPHIEAAYSEANVVEGIRFQTTIIDRLFKFLEDCEEARHFAANKDIVTAFLEEQLDNSGLQPGNAKILNQDKFWTSPTMTREEREDKLKQALEEYSKLRTGVQALCESIDAEISTSGDKTQKRAWFGETRQTTRFAGMRRLLMSPHMHTKDAVLKFKDQLFVLLRWTKPTPIGARTRAASAMAAQPRALSEDTAASSWVQDDVRYLSEIDQGLSIIVAGILQGDAEKSRQFVEALCIQVGDDDWMRKRKYQAQFHKIIIAPGKFDCAKEQGGNPSQYDHDEDMILEGHPIQTLLQMPEKLQPEVNCFGYRANTLEYCVYWSPLTIAFQGMPCEDVKVASRRMLELLYAFERAPAEVLGTPFVQVWVHYHMSKLWTEYCVHRCVDACILFLFACISDDLHTAQWIPKSQVYIALICLHLYSASTVLLGTIYAVSVYSWRRAWRACFNPYTLLFMICDVYTVVVVIQAWLQDSDIHSDGEETGFSMQAPFFRTGAVNQTFGYEETWPGQHPNRLLMCVGARWVSTMMQLMNIGEIGRAILPVFEAIGNKVTLILMTYLSVCTAGGLMVYYCFPLTIDDSGLGVAFTRIVRLVFFTDFDLNEMAGVNGVVQGKIFPVANSDHYEAELTEDDGDRVNWTHGVWFFTFFLGGVGVLFMNTLIAVLGDSYNECKDQISERLVKYRLALLKRSLLRGHALDRIRRCFQRDEQPSSTATAASVSTATGVFMRIPRDFLPKEYGSAKDDNDAGRSNLSNVVESRLDGVKTQMKDRMDALEERLRGMQTQNQRLEEAMRGMATQNQKLIDFLTAQGH